MIPRLMAALAAVQLLLLHLVGPPSLTGNPAGEVPYEFRGLWVATVNNLDWPSRRGLSADQQVAELTGIMDRAAALNFNAVVFQVRCECDAFYNSPYEPWSYFLTGSQGTPPSPAYDPLALAVDLAHKRGMELHAWFNPYRAGLPATKGKQAAGHVSTKQPDIVRQIGDHLWLDPSEPQAAEHIRRVIKDIVTRYNIDGIHYDDYFYPYRSYYKGGSTQFPDDRQWNAYRERGGQASRDDWRRDHVNKLVQQIYDDVKSTKAHVKVGISPFGIWRPGNPEGIVGMDQYAELYADARLWLNKGWLDYCTPQLYWKTKAPQQPYARLLNWWIAQNKERRHVWPGLIPGNVEEKDWPVSEIVDQVTLTRASGGATGNVHFRARNVLGNASLSEAFRKLHADGALVPPSPWLANARPATPNVTVDSADTPGKTVNWAPGGNEAPARWALFAKYGERWSVRTVPVQQTRLRLPADLTSKPAEIAIAAVDAAGNLSELSTVTIGP